MHHIRNRQRLDREGKTEIKPILIKNKGQFLSGAQHHYASLWHDRPSEWFIHHFCYFNLSPSPTCWKAQALICLLMMENVGRTYVERVKLLHEWQLSRVNACTLSCLGVVWRLGKGCKSPLHVDILLQQHMKHIRSCKRQFLCHQWISHWRQPSSSR